jgi:predicted dienelactone hydrolase
MSRHLASSRTFFWLALVTLLLSLPRLASAESGSGPKPTGKYAVGRTLLYCVDPHHRSDPVAEDPAAKREFMVIVWYPAKSAAGASRAPWMPAPWAASETDLLYYRRRHSDAPLTRDQAEHAVHDPVSYSVADAVVAKTRSKWPVLLFEPGAGVNAAFYSAFTEDLASHGYVVFGIEPTGWVSTRFPDSHTTPFSDKRSDDPAWFIGTAFPLWAADLRFTLDQITAWNNDPKSLFFHRLDLTKVGAFGHSFGGGSSILAALDDPRIKAVLNLDGSPFNILSERSFSKPLMVIKHNVSPQYQQLPPDEHGKAVQAQVEEELSSLYLKGSPGFRVDILDAQHMSFSDMAFLSTWAEAGRRYGTHNPADGAATVMVIRDYILAFFDKFLRGKDSTLLHLDHPESVISTLRSTAESK